MFAFVGKCEAKSILIGSNAGITSVDIDFDVSVVFSLLLKRLKIELGLL